MPTENRSSNTEMVSVPREWAQHYADLLEERCGYEKAEQVTAFLAQPAEQHQGEPVGTLLIDEYFDGREVGDVDVQLDTKVCGQLAEKYPGQSLPLYICPAPADPGEVEALRGAYLRAGEREHELRKELAALRQHKTDYMEAAEETRKALLAQLAERDALLRDLEGKTILSWPDKRRISAALSASAEPTQGGAQ